MLAALEAMSIRTSPPRIVTHFFKNLLEDLRFCHAKAGLDVPDAQTGLWGKMSGDWTHITLNNREQCGATNKVRVVKFTSLKSCLVLFPSHICLIQ